MKERPEHILKTMRFLSLRYSADLRRSRLVSVWNNVRTRLLKNYAPENYQKINKILDKYFF